MSKKIIAILTVATILFVCIFVACGKEDDPYEGMNLVTDSSGEKVLAEDGRYIVYVTEANGELVTDESGEPVTELSQFIANTKDGVLEDYGFKLKIPDGWSATDKGNVFQRSKGETVEIRLVKKLYNEYYSTTEKVYSKWFESGVKGSIKEDKTLVKGAEDAFKLIIDVKEEAYVTVVCANSGNLYNITYKATGVEADFNAIDDFLENMTFKPYTYYPEITAPSTASESEKTTVDTTK